MTKKIIQTAKAPQAIGPYSQAVEVNGLLYLSGQIPLRPDTMMLVEGGVKEQAIQVFQNLLAVAEAAESKLDNAVKITIYLQSMDDFPIVNDVMMQFFTPPYPARATIGVNELPKGSLVEVDAMIALS